MKNLHAVFEKYGLNLSNQQENQFDKYFSMLVETNKVVNLTAITEENEVLIKHFLDSAIPEKLITRGASVVDVGSGAGFPALPLKIVRPDLEICMVDSLNKRVNFLADVISALNLSKTTSTHSRAEDFAKTNREKFDVAIARAVAPLNTLVEYLLPLVRIGGQAIIYKSAKLDEELSKSETAIKILGAKVEKIENFTLENEFERNILVLKKIKPTPKQYPRAKNLPKTKPIQ